MRNSNWLQMGLVLVVSLMGFSVWGAEKAMLPIPLSIQREALEQIAFFEMAARGGAEEIEELVRQQRYENDSEDQAELKKKLDEIKLRHAEETGLVSDAALWPLLSLFQGSIGAALSPMARANNINLLGSMLFGHGKSDLDTDLPHVASAQRYIEGNVSLSEIAKRFMILPKERMRIDPNTKEEDLRFFDLTYQEVVMIFQQCEQMQMDLENKQREAESVLDRENEQEMQVYAFKKRRETLQFFRKNPSCLLDPEIVRSSVRSVHDPVDEPLLDVTNFVASVKNLPSTDGFAQLYPETKLQILLVFSNWLKFFAPEKASALECDVVSTICRLPLEIQTKFLEKLGVWQAADVLAKEALRTAALLGSLLLGAPIEDNNNDNPLIGCWQSKDFTLTIKESGEAVIASNLLGSWNQQGNAIEVLFEMPSQKIKLVITLQDNDTASAVFYEWEASKQDWKERPAIVLKKKPPLL